MFCICSPRLELRFTTTVFKPIRAAHVLNSQLPKRLHLSFYEAIQSTSHIVYIDMLPHYYCELASTYLSQYWPIVVTRPQVGTNMQTPNRHSDNFRAMDGNQTNREKCLDCKHEDARGCSLWSLNNGPCTVWAVTCTNSGTIKSMERR